MNRAPLWAEICGALGLWVIATGCGTTHSIKSPKTNAPVRKVDFSGSPELNEFAERARLFGNEMYPKVCALLLDETAKPPRQFDVFLVPLKSRNTGEAHLEARRIYINSDYLTNSPDLNERFEKVFVHEMSHLATQYRPWSLAFWKSDPPANSYWGESIADYAFYKLIGTNGWGCPECNQRYPHYTSGYTCGGAFLLYLEAQHGTNLVRELTTTLRKHRYSEAFFADSTGKSLAASWADFQKTAAFKPGATRVFELQQALGYENGEPPKNVEKRFKQFVNQHADPLTRRALAAANLDDKAVKDLPRLLAIYLYFTQPGGTPEHLLAGLRAKGQLPGFAKDEKGWLSTTIKYDVMEPQTFPVTRTLTGSKTNDASTYHYVTVCASEGAAWKLEKAWRSASDGEVIEEFVLP